MDPVAAALLGGTRSDHGADELAHYGVYRCRQRRDEAERHALTTVSLATLRGRSNRSTPSCMVRIVFNEELFVRACAA